MNEEFFNIDLDEFMEIEVQEKWENLERQEEEINGR